MKKNILKRNLAITVGGLLLAFTAHAASNNNGGIAPQVLPGASQPSHGLTMCTAAINSTGVVVSGQHVFTAATATFRVGLGQYQVAFAGPCNPATAASGHSRWVQVDTLTTGTAPQVSCTTADRGGVANAVWVECKNGAGVLTDTSFFLFVAR